MPVIVRTVEDLHLLWEKVAAHDEDLTKDEVAAAEKLTESLKIMMGVMEAEFVEGACGVPLLDVYGADGTPLRGYEWYTSSRLHGGIVRRKRVQTLEHLVQCRWMRFTGDDGVPRAQCFLKEPVRMCLGNNAEAHYACFRTWR